MHLVAAPEQPNPVLDPVDLCSSLLGSITEHRVFVGPATDYEWMRDWLQKLTVAEVNQTFRSLWNPESFAFYVSGDVGMQLAPPEIIKTVQKHRRGELPFLLPAPPKDIVFKLNHPGPATTVVERREVPALGARLLRLGNNVRVNIVPNKQEPGRLNTGITVVGKHAVIPRGVRIGRNVRIAADIRSSDFVGRVVRSGESVEPKAAPRRARDVEPGATRVIVGGARNKRRDPED